ncbi:MAG: hypothetical protein AAF498_01190 [Pseudomonadota bacterium]
MASVFFLGIALGVVALRLAWAKRQEARPWPLMLSWILIVAGLIAWTMHYKDVGLTFAVVTAIITALTLIGAAAFQSWSARDRNQVRKRPSRETTSDEQTEKARLRTAKSAAAVLLAGPVAGALSITLCISIGRLVETNGWSEQDKLGLIYIGVPVVWAILATYMLMARTWRRRATSTFALITVSGLSLIATG